MSQLSLFSAAAREPQLTDLEGLLAIPRRLGYDVEYRRAERPAALSPQ